MINKRQHFVSSSQSPPPFTCLCILCSRNVRHWLSRSLDSTPLMLLLLLLLLLPPQLSWPGRAWAPPPRRYSPGCTAGSPGRGVPLRSSWGRPTARPSARHPAYQTQRQPPGSSTRSVFLPVSVRTTLRRDISVLTTCGISAMARSGSVALTVAPRVLTVDDRGPTFRLALWQHA